MCALDNHCTRVEWLAEYGVTESWLTGWFSNIHCQPEGWEKTEEAKLQAPNAKEDGRGGSGSEARAAFGSGNAMPHNHNVKKIGRLLEQLNQNCINVYKVHEMCSIDEQTALCNSRLCSLKHVQRHKKYDGIRIYSVNGSYHIDAGYTQCFMVDWKCGFSTTTFADKLLEMMPKVYYSVYMDNAFPTVTHLLQWREQKFNVCGTARVNFGFPKQLAALKRTQQVKIENHPLKKGDHDWLMSPDGLLAAMWHDVGYVMFLSNFHKPDTSTCARRVKSAEAAAATAAGTEVVNGRIQRATLLGIMAYNMFMGGTDRCDALRGFNTTQRKSVKWWHSLLFWALDIAYVNAYTVYVYDFEKNRKEGSKEKPMERKEFLHEIHLKLMGPKPKTTIWQEEGGG